MTDGAFFISMSSKAGEDIETFFLQYRANWDKFYLTQNKAKFFVFDSSADIDPDYSIDYCRMMNCSKYRTNLNLSINQININASKSQIVKNNNKNAPQIRAAIWKRIQEESRKTKNGLLTITYSELDSFFIGGRVKRGHFGGIKGLNTFSDLTKVFHIGNNRLSEFEYFMKMILLKPEILEELKQMDEEESRRYIEDAIAMKMGLYVDNELNELMYRSILADFEQNIFRVKIRDFRNTDHVEVFAYWDSNMFDRLNELIKERYEPLGVKFKCLGVPAEIKKIKVETRQSKNGEKTIPQRILTWIDKQPTGNEFRVAKILSELDITDKQFQKAKKNQVIADLFKNMSTGQKGIYRVNPP